MSSVLTLFFEPLDVLHFREPRPWDAGSHVLSKSSFPTPGTLRGALRSALLARLDADFGSPDPHYGIKQEWAKRLLGGRTDPGLISIRGPFLAVSPELHKSSLATKQKPLPLFPPPQDLVFLKTEDKDGRGGPKPKGSVAEVCVRQLQRRRLPTEDVAPIRYHFNSGRLQQDAGTELPWASQELDKKSLTGQYLFTEKGVSSYLANQSADDLVLSVGRSLDKQGAALLRQSAVYQIESRIGIARDPDSLTAKEGMFYLALSYRFAGGAGLAIEVDVQPSGGSDADGTELAKALADLHRAVIPLGGRGHRARVHVSDGPLFAPSLRGHTLYEQKASASSQRQKVWLVSPLLWPTDRQEKPDGIATLVSDRPQVIGGFDQAQRCPKPLRFALSAGSVLYLKEGASWPSVRESLCKSPWPEDSFLGYGTAFLSP